MTVDELAAQLALIQFKGMGQVSVNVEGYGTVEEVQFRPDYRDVWILGRD